MELSLQTNAVVTKVSERVLDFVSGNRVFGDSYPPNTFADLKDIIVSCSQRCVDTSYRFIDNVLGHRFAEEIYIHAGSKAPPMVASSAIGLIDFSDPSQLEGISLAAECLALVQAVDDSIDMGRRNFEGPITFYPAEEINNGAAKALKSLYAKIVAVAADPQDPRPAEQQYAVMYLADQVMNRTLKNEVRLLELSRSTNRGMKAMHETADISINNVAVDFAVGAVYQIVRRANPDIPSLERLFDPVDPDTASLTVFRRAGHAFTRLIDEMADRFIDSEPSEEWGDYKLNPFGKNAEGKYLDELLEVYIQNSATNAEELEILQKLKPQCIDGQLESRDSKDYVDRVYKSLLDYIRASYEAIPAHVKEKYAVYLTIYKRILEAAYAGSLGDPAFKGAN